MLAEIAAKDGETVGVGALLGQISDSGAAPAKDVKAAAAPAAKAAAAISPAATPAVPAAATGPAMAPSPAAAKIAADNGLDPAAIEGSGKRGQVLKGDVLAKSPSPGAQPPRRAAPAPRARAGPRAFAAPTDAAREERVRMTRLRQTIARRLKDAQNTAAMLTTFNEVDMTEVMALRAQIQGCCSRRSMA